MKAVPAVENGAGGEGGKRYEVVCITVEKLEGIDDTPSPPLITPLLSFCAICLYLLSLHLPPPLAGYYTGTGDCTAALMLAWIHLTSENIVTALTNTMATIQALYTLLLNIAYYHGFLLYMYIYGLFCIIYVLKYKHSMVEILFPPPPMSLF